MGVVVCSGGTVLSGLIGNAALSSPCYESCEPIPVVVTPRLRLQSLAEMVAHVAQREAVDICAGEEALDGKSQGPLPLLLLEPAARKETCDEMRCIAGGGAG